MIILFRENQIEKIPLSQIGLIVGTIDTQVPGQTYSPIKIVYHPWYNRGGRRENDIALIKTDRPIQFSDSINAVCLIEKPNPNDTTLLISGFGVHKFSSYQPSRYLNKVTLNIISNDVCGFELGKSSFDDPEDPNKRFNRIYSTQICTYTPHHDACQVSQANN